MSFVFYIFSSHKKGPSSHRILTLKKVGGEKVGKKKRNLDKDKTTIKICYLFLVAQLIFQVQSTVSDLKDSQN